MTSTMTAEFPITGSSCAFIGPRTTPASASDICTAAAADYSGKVAGAFATTIAMLRGLAPLPSSPSTWPGLADDHPAVLCYIDGTIAKSPPVGPDGKVPAPFDRGILAVVDGRSNLIVAGYKDQLPVAAP